MAATTSTIAASDPFHVGQLVHVAPRTWPGINQPGGIGRLTGIARDRVSVRYILDGRHEKEIKVKYIRVHQQQKSRRLRDRSMLLGRCNLCGSLRTDCGSCDLWVEEEQVWETQVSSSSSVVNKTQEKAAVASSALVDSDSSSSDEELERMQKRNQRRYRKYLRIKARAERYLADDESSSDDSISGTTGVNDAPNEKESTSLNKADAGISSSNSDDDDDFPLQQLAWHSTQMESPSSRPKRFSRPTSSMAPKRKRPIGRLRQERSILEKIADEQEQSAPSHLSVEPLGSQDLSDASSAGGGASPRQLQQQQGPRGPADDDSIPSSPPMDPEDIDMLQETQDGFIQPEGNAENLPDDIRDATRHLKYAELAPFFDETANELENDRIPDFKLRVTMLERRWKESATAEAKDELYEHSQLLYDDCIRQLIRRGLDQCQLALRKLSNKRLYRQHKASLSEEERKACRGRGKMDTREFRMDTLSQSSEAIISKLRNLSEDMEQACERVRGSDDEASSDGWADPSAGASQSQVPTMESPSQPSSPSSDLPGFDPHMHARRKAKDGPRRVPVQRTTMKAGHRREAAVASRSSSGTASSRQYTSSSRAEPVKRRRPKEPAKRSFEEERGADSSPDSNEVSGRALGVDNGSSKRRRPSELSKNVSREEPATELNSDADEAMDSEMVFASDDEMPAPLSDNETPSGVRKSTRTVRRQVTLNPAFLDAGTSGGVGRDERAATGGQQDRIPIADRMQRFLDANDGGDLALSSPQSLDKTQRNAQRRRARRARQGPRESDGERGGNRRDRSSSRATVAEPEEEGPVNQVELFSLLDDRPDHSAEEHQEEPSLRKTVPQLCDLLVARFPDPACVKPLKGLLASMKTRSETSEHSVLVFTTMLKLLRSSGSTLQDLVAAECSTLPVYVALLATTLRLLRLDLNKSLTSADAVVFEIFAPDHYTRYIDLVMLQVVETVLSLVHPFAWALQVKNARKIFRSLEPIRDALAEHVHLVERVCRCLDQELEPQEWRCVASGQRVFVSSVNPESWATFLESGVPVRRKGALRSSAFGKELPRCEVEAIWSSLAYFSCSPMPPKEDKGIIRWQLISKLFTRSVLAGASSESLSPSESQLAVCAGELNHLTSLLLSGALDDLPGRDTILVNLIQRSLLLQADALLYSEESRLAAYPSIDEKGDKRFCAKLWKSICADTDTQSARAVQQDFFDIGKALPNSREISSFMGLPIVLPSSRIAQSCLALVSAWTRQVPLKKARRSRLANAFKSLTNSLLEQCGDLEANPGLITSPAVEADSFQAAFSSGPFSSSTPVKSGLGPRRKALFLREAAAYLTVTSVVAMSIQDASNRTQWKSAVYERVWEILSDETMKKRREGIVQGNVVRRPEDLVDDSHRFYLAAKAITFVALLYLGVTPWSTIVPEKELTTGSFVAGEDGDRTLEYLVSCLVACLDCACDSRLSIEIVASISSCLGIVLGIAQRLKPSNPESPPPQRPIVSLSNLPVMLVPTLERGFRLLITASFCGPEEDLCLMSLLTTLRGTLSWSANTANERETETGTNSPLVQVASNDNSQDDEFWGGMDDDLLASIDLGAAGVEGRADIAAGPWLKMYKLFTESLDQAKPSTRFAIVQSSGHSTESGLAVATASGRKLIATRSGLLCRCLAVLLSSDTSESSCAVALVSKLWKSPGHFEVGADRRDIDFRKGLAQRISSELCRLALSIPRCRELVRCNREDMLSNLLDTLLDPAVLKKYPSCNLVGIKANGGESSEQKELSRLMKLNDRASTSGDAVKEVWSFCGALGHVLAENEQGDENASSSELGFLLLKPDTDLVLPERRQLMVSMEKEYLDRFKMLRGIVTLVAKTPSPQFEFEKLSSLLIASMAGHLLVLAKKFSIQERGQGETVSLTYDRAKGIEELSSYIEFQVSVLSWVFRERRNVSPDTGLGSWTTICNEYLSPLLHNRDFNIFGVLDRIASIAFGVTEGTTSRARATVAGTTETRACRDMLTQAIVRRSREFMVGIAHDMSVGNTQGSSGFLRAMLFIGTSQDSQAASIGLSFCSKAYSLPPKANSVALSPLQTSIDEYLSRVVKCHPLSNQDARSLLSLKRYALKEVLIPRLVHERSCLRTKNGIVRLLRFMLETEHDEGSLDGVEARLDPFVLCFLAKGLCLSLRACLCAPAVDDELVASIFTCATSLVNIPATCIDHEAVGWLIHWCSSCGSNDTPFDISEKQNQAGYLWSFSCWLMDMGQVICKNSGEPDTERIQSVRFELQKKQASGDTTSWPRLTEGTASADRMKCYENLLFPEREKDQNITNVYASRKITNSADKVMERWVPSSNVSLSVKRFVAEVKPVCAALSPRALLDEM